MRSKLIFYLFVVAIVGGSGYLGYSIFFSSKSPSTESSISSDSSSKEDVANSQQNALKKEFKSKQNSSLTHSIWSDQNLGKMKYKSKYHRSAEEDLAIRQKVESLMKLYKSHQDKELIQELNKLLAEHPNTPEYLAMAGDLYYDREEYGKAEGYIKKLVQVDPTNLTAHNILGEVYAINGKLDQAGTQMDQVLQQDPGNTSALYGKIAIEDAKGDPAPAYEEISRLAKANPDNVNLQMTQVDILKAQMKFKEANEIRNDLMKKHPESPAPYRSYAVDYLRSGHYEKAKEFAEDWMKRESNPQQIQMSKDLQLQAMVGLNHWNEAESFVKKWINEDPNNQLAKVRLQMLKNAEQLQKQESQKK